MGSQTDPDGCPQCEAAGRRFSADVSNMSSKAVGTSGCSNGCEAKIAGPVRNIIGGPTGTLLVATVESTGLACSATIGSNRNGNEAPPGECTTNGGAQLCLETESQCGVVNGDRVCPKSIAEGCVAYSSGGVACVVSGPGAVANTAPPLPNQGAGAPTTPATPTGTVEAGGKTVNYYNRTTVNNSTTNPTDEAPGTVGGDPSTGGGSSGGGGDPGTGGSGTVNSDGEDTADGTCEGTECSGTGALVPSLDELDSFQAITQAYWSSISEAPILAAVEGISTGLPSGSCPSWSLSLSYIGYDGSLDLGCDIFATIGPVLAAVMLAVWSILGIVIVLRA